MMDGTACRGVWKRQAVFSVYIEDVNVVVINGEEYEVEIDKMNWAAFRLIIGMYWRKQV